MALNFKLRTKTEYFVPVTIDGVVYRAAAGSANVAKAVMGLKDRLDAFARFSDEREGVNEGNVMEAIAAIESIDAPLRKVVGEMFGEESVGAIVGEGSVDIVTALAIVEMMTQVMRSNEYLLATAKAVSARAKTQD